MFKRYLFVKNNYFQFTFNPSWESSDTLQHIYIDVILYTLYTSWQTISMYNFLCTSVHITHS
jgi:hypothetical protein